jgi:hypothetical protein
MIYEMYLQLLGRAGARQGRSSTGLLLVQTHYDEDEMQAACPAWSPFFDALAAKLARSLLVHALPSQMVTGSMIFCLPL